MQLLEPQMLAVFASPFIGSFIGLVAIRLPAGRSIFGRSICDHCGAELKIIDLIPIASWLALGGRCRSCRTSIELIHPISEIAAVIVALWAAVSVPPALIWPTLLFGWALLAISLIDLRQQIIPDKMSIPLGGAGLLTAAVLNSETLSDHVIGAAAGFLALWLVGVAYLRLRGRTGLGGGDPKLFAAVGTWVGWQGLPGVLLYASLSGIVLALILRLMGSKITRTSRLPFGPHLALGGWLVWLYGPLVLG